MLALPPEQKRRGVSLRKAVNAMCRHCIYDSSGLGNWKQQVQLCTSFNCPLWAVRPVSSVPLPESTRKALPRELAHLFDHLDTRPHDRSNLIQKTAVKDPRITQTATGLESPKDSAAGSEP